MAQFLFITDLDHTLVGDDRALAILNQRLSQHRDEYGSIIVYSTGRSPTLYQQLRHEQEMIDPDYAVLSVGTLIYPGNSAVSLPEWNEYLSDGWDRDALVAIAAQFSDLVPQPDSEQTPHKISYYLDEAIAPDILLQLETGLKQQGWTVQIIYSAGQDLDILPQRGNKGAAVQFLQETLAIAPERTVVCGDSGNDLSMFTPKRSKGIIVGNAKPELRQWYETTSPDHVYLATGHCSNGILEGLQSLGFLD
ncbi:MAG: sucrose-phosphate phosphatase [Merismopedia sp. SIO2A8]|nr:sucrose-phosphate phosphatase [Merismopedia sp. SIO2A8]